MICRLQVYFSRHVPSRDNPRPRRANHQPIFQQPHHHLHLKLLKPPSQSAPKQTTEYPQQPGLSLFFSMRNYSPLFLFGEFPLCPPTQTKNPLKSHLSRFGANKPNKPPQKKQKKGHNKNPKIVSTILQPAKKKSTDDFLASLPARQSATNPIDDGQIPPRADPRIPPGSAPRWRRQLKAQQKPRFKNLGKRRNL